MILIVYAFDIWNCFFLVCSMQRVPFHLNWATCDRRQWQPIKLIEGCNSYNVIKQLTCELLFEQEIRIRITAALEKLGVSRANCIYISQSQILMIIEQQCQFNINTALIKSISRFLRCSWLVLWFGLYYPMINGVAIQGSAAEFAECPRTVGSGWTRSARIFVISIMVCTAPNNQFLFWHYSLFGLWFTVHRFRCRFQCIRSIANKEPVRLSFFAAEQWNTSEPTSCKLRIKTESICKWICRFYFRDYQQLEEGAVAAASSGVDIHTAILTKTQKNTENVNWSRPMNYSCSRQTQPDAASMWLVTDAHPYGLWQHAGSSIHLFACIVLTCIPSAARTAKRKNSFEICMHIAVVICAYFFAGKHMNEIVEDCEERDADEKYNVLSYEIKTIFISDSRVRQQAAPTKYNGENRDGFCFVAYRSEDH